MFKYSGVHSNYFATLCDTFMEHQKLLIDFPELSVYDKMANAGMTKVCCGWRLVALQVLH